MTNLPNTDDDGDDDDDTITEGETIETEFVFGVTYVAQVGDTSCQAALDRLYDQSITVLLTLPGVTKVEPCPYAGPYAEDPDEFTS